jgi:hypothetical protein
MDGPGGGELKAKLAAYDKLEKQLDNLVTKLSYEAIIKSVPAEAREIQMLLARPEMSELDGRSPDSGKLAGAPGGAASSSGPASSGGLFGMSGGPASSASSAPGGFLFRVVDPMRVARYLEQLERFRDEAIEFRVAEFVSTQSNRLASTVADLEKQAAAVVLDDAGAGSGIMSAADVSLRKRQYADAKVSATKSFARAVRASADSYVSLHTRFVRERHGEGMRYMRYWHELRDVDGVGLDDTLKAAIKEHQGGLVVLVNEARAKLVDDIRKKVLDTQRSALASGGEPRLDDTQQAEVDRTIDGLGEWLVERAESVEELYLSGSPTLFQSATEPVTMMLYALKALRLGIAYFALSVASRTFQGMYMRRVYTLDEPPPSPAILVGLALVLDASLHAIVLLVLYTAMRVFKSPDNNFPIDAVLLRAWAYDYGAATIAVGALSLILGEVVRSKKYFRYKYEGERGIRAMRELMFYVYCVLLPMPFYRLTFSI